MRRRDFIKGIAVSSTWPLAARAQQAAMPVVGFLRSVSLADAADLVTAFRQGLKETGYIDGQNVVIELRSAEGHLDRANGRCRSVPVLQSRTASRAGGAPCVTDALSRSRRRYSWWPDGLRTKHCGCLSSGWDLRWAGSQG